MKTDVGFFHMPHRFCFANSGLGRNFISSMDAEIIAVGSELLTAYSQDTNSLYLTGKLNSLGIEVRFKTVVGDDHDRLSDALKIALKRSGLVLLTGGLGPTEDDITRNVASDIMGRPLREDAEIRKRIEKRFRDHRRSMPLNNLRQTLVPEGATWLENPSGTAPGIWLEHDGVIVILLPGPPRELEVMFESTCMPRLSSLGGNAHIQTRVYKVIGLAESEVDRRISPLYKAYSNPVTTILAQPGVIEVHLRARTEGAEEGEAIINQLGDQMEMALGDHVFSTRGEALEAVVGMYLVMKQWTVAIAESCTGGLLSQRLTTTPGSSNYFLGGVVCYGNPLKTAFTGVSAREIEEHGAVSKKVAQGLSEGIRRRANSTLGVGITGIAGPGGGSATKPVGLVFIGLAEQRGTTVREFLFPGDRDHVRFLASQMALEMIRRRVRG